MVDLDRIHQRLELLAGYLRELRRLRDLPVVEYIQREAYAGRDVRVHSALATGLPDLDAFATAVAQLAS